MYRTQPAYVCKKPGTFDNEQDAIDKQPEMTCSISLETCGRTSLHVTSSVITAQIDYHILPEQNQKKGGEWNSKKCQEIKIRTVQSSFCPLLSDKALQLSLYTNTCLRIELNRYCFQAQKF